MPVDTFGQPLSIQYLYSNHILKNNLTAIIILQQSFKLLYNIKKNCN